MTDAEPTSRENRPFDPRNLAPALLGYIWPLEADTGPILEGGAASLVVTLDANDGRSGGYRVPSQGWSC